MNHPLLPCASFKICIQPQSGEFAAPADQTVLQSALNSGYALPSSCRNGVCRTCLCRLHSGRVSYRMAVANNQLVTKTFQNSSGLSDVYQFMLSFRYSFN